MALQPQAMSEFELRGVLAEIQALVGARDSFTGSFEYDALAGPVCTVCHGRTQQDPPCSHCEGWGIEPLPEGKDFWVHGAYRIGNSEGQGGVRFVGSPITEGPEDGHRFEFSVRSSMSSSVHEPGKEPTPKTDADWWGPPHTLTVRAWNLTAACAKAASTPFPQWGGLSEVDIADVDGTVEVSREALATVVAQLRRLNEDYIEEVYGAGQNAETSRGAIDEMVEALGAPGLERE